MGLSLSFFMLLLLCLLCEWVIRPPWQYSPITDSQGEILVVKVVSEEPGNYP